MSSYCQPSPMDSRPMDGSSTMSALSDEEDSGGRVYHGLYIPTQADPREYAIHEQQLYPLHWEDLTFGCYNIRIYYLDKRHPEENIILSTLVGRQVKGAIVIIDPTQELTLEDLQNFYKYRVF